MSYRKLLVPIDFSDYAHNALNYAISIAKHQGSMLVLLHACEIPVPSTEMGLVYDPDLAESFEAEAEGKLKQLYRQYPGLADLVEFHKVREGPVAEVILEEIENSDIDLTIMGTHGAHNAFDELVGSNTLHIIKKSEKPVLVIPGDSKLERIKQILFAFDYQSVTNVQVLQPLVDFARYFGAEIHVLHITEKIQRLDEGAVGEAKQLEQYLRGIRHHYHMIESDDVESGIELYMKEHSIDVLAVMPRKHNLWESLFKSSITRKMVHHSKVPLFAFREE